MPDISLLHRWMEASGGRIRIVTLAPELPGSIPFIRECVSLGIIAAIGHTGATGAEIRAAAEAGATLSTHLGNGSHSMLPRHPNYIWAQLAEDELHATMIADGFHLDDAVLKVFFRAKGEKAILVSDSMSHAGLPPGTYDSPIAGRVCLTPEGLLHMEGNPLMLAGSASALLDGVRKMAAIVGFVQAWDAGSARPAGLLDPSGVHGLHPGAPADLVLLEPGPDKMKIRSVYRAGFKEVP